MEQPEELLDQYMAGSLTRGELLIRLCQAAADRPPEQIAAALPAEVLAKLRARSAAPPESPGRCRVFHAGGFIGYPEFWERYFREVSRRLYDGLWRWHRYFAGTATGTS